MLAAGFIALAEAMRENPQIDLLKHLDSCDEIIIKILTTDEKYLYVQPWMFDGKYKFEMYHAMCEVINHANIESLKFDLDGYDRERDSDYQNIFFDTFSKNTSVKDLRLSVKDVNNCAQACADMLKKNMSLTYIEINSNSGRKQLIDSSAHAFAEALAVNTSVTYLQFYDFKDLSVDGVLSLARAAKRNKNLQIWVDQDGRGNWGKKDIIELFRNEQGPSNSLRISHFYPGIYQAYSEGLSDNTFVKSLDICISDGHDSAGFQLLPQALKGNTTIEEVTVRGGGDRSGTAFDDESCRALAEIISDSTSIKKLELSSGVSVSDIGGQMLVDALKLNQSIKELCLNLHSCDKDALMHGIGEVLRDSDTVEYLHLGECEKVTPESLMFFFSMQ